MPEGHVIHRLADTLDAAFAGRRVEVTSPQGRFAPSAALLDGATLIGAEAWGKHLFITFDAPVLEPILHVHLGLIGRFQVSEPAPPVGQVRVRIADGEHVADLRGPQTCRLISRDGQLFVTRSLGGDPLRSDADPEASWRRIHASRRSIASLLLDQRIAAGVGNIYRCEVLFRHRIPPLLEGTRLTHEEWSAIWADLRALMADGVAVGRIDTVMPEHTPEAMGRPPRVDRHGGEVYVYRRAGMPCLVCGAPVRATNLEGRTLYWCDRCQAEG